MTTLTTTPLAPLLDRLFEQAAETSPLAVPAATILPFGWIATADATALLPPKSVVTLPPAPNVVSSAPSLL